MNVRMWLHKATQKNLISLIDRPTIGSIHFDKKQINFNDRKKNDIFRAKNIGIVYQHNNLLPDFTALENVYLACLSISNNKDLAISNNRSFNIAPGRNIDVIFIDEGDYFIDSFYWGYSFIDKKSNVCKCAKPGALILHL